MCTFLCDYSHGIHTVSALTFKWLSQVTTRQMFLSSEPPGKPLVYRRMILLYFSRIIKEGEEEKEAFLNMTCKSCLLLSRLANLFYKYPYSKYFSACKSCSGTPPSQLVG